MRRLSFLFLMLCASFFVKANVWENVNKKKSAIDFQTIIQGNSSFDVKFKDSGSTVVIEFQDKESKEIANTLIFVFNEEGVCEKLNVKFTCEDCYFEHLEKLQDLKLLKQKNKQGFVVRSHFKDLGDYVDYSILFVSKV